MSVSIYVHAQKKILPEEKGVLVAYNQLISAGLPVSPEHIAKIKAIIGREPDVRWEERLELDYDGLVELYVEGEGDVMYYDGMVLKLEDLPKGTVSLRIFAFS